MFLKEVKKSLQAPEVLNHQQPRRVKTKNKRKTKNPNQKHKKFKNHRKTT